MYMYVLHVFPQSSAVSVCIYLCHYVCIILLHFRCIDEVTKGNLSDRTKQILEDITSPEPNTPSDKTVLCCLNSQTEFFNASMLTQLTGRRQLYRATDTGDARLLQNFSSAQKHLYLKPGSPVIVTCNLSANIVNGTTGVVHGLSTDSVTISTTDNHLHVITRFLFHVTSTSRPTSRLQFPLKLAWAITIHRAQGLTLPSVHVDCSGLFVAGQLSVALSRVRRVEDVTISNLNTKSILPVSDVVLSFLAGEYIPTINTVSICRLLLYHVKILTVWPYYMHRTCIVVWAL